MSTNSSAVTSTQTQPPSLPHEKLEITVSVVVYSLLSLLIIVGNSLVIAAYLSNSRLQTLTNTFLAWLAVSDLLVGLIAVPLWMYVSSCQQFRSCSTSNELLIFYGTVDVFTGCTSILQLTVISLERFFAITRPLSHRTYSVNVYRGMIIWAWVSSFVLAGLFPLQIHYNWMEAYSIIIATACYALPTTVIIGVYIAIFKTARGASGSRVHPVATSTSTRRRHQNETKIAVTIAVITGFFVVAWTPFYVVNLLAQFRPSCLPAHPKILRLIRFVKWMHYSNSVVNPFVYTYRNTEMRKTFARLLRACFCCCSNNLVEMNSSTRSLGLGQIRAGNVHYQLQDGGSNDGSKEGSKHTSGGGRRAPFVIDGDLLEVRDN